jgi:hypothetical protein
MQANTDALSHLRVLDISQMVRDFLLLLTTVYTLHSVITIIRTWRYNSLKNVLLIRTSKLVLCMFRSRSCITSNLHLFEIFL